MLNQILRLKRTKTVFGLTLKRILTVLAFHFYFSSGANVIRTWLYLVVSWSCLHVVNPIARREFELLQRSLKAYSEATLNRQHECTHGWTNWQRFGWLNEEVHRAFNVYGAKLTTVTTEPNNIQRLSEVSICWKSATT